MTLRRKVNNGPRPVLRKCRGNQLPIADVPMNKPVVWVVLHGIQITQATRIRKRIHIDNRALASQNSVQYKIGPNESSAPRNEYSSMQHSFRLTLDSCERPAQFPNGLFSILATLLLE